MTMFCFDPADRKTPRCFMAGGVFCMRKGKARLFLCLCGNVQKLMIGILQLSDKNAKLCVILVTAGIIVMLAFGIVELRYSDAGRVPLFDIRLLKNRNLRNGTLVRFLTSFVMAGTLFALSVFLLSVLKLSAFETGLMLMPVS